MSRLSVIDWICLLLIIVGGLNWGLVGAFNFNLVETIFRNMPQISKIVYILVGIAAIYVLITIAKFRRT